MAFSEPATPLPPAANRPADFVKDIQPIFAAKCYSCHGPREQKSSYRLDVKAVALKGGEIDRSIIAGQSAQSPLIQYVSGLDENITMPPDGEPLTAKQVGLLRAWIDQGAKWPDSASARLEEQSTHWAYKPLVKPSVPSAFISNPKSQIPNPKSEASPDWVRNPIDAFVLQALQKNGMAPSAWADKRTLIRRVTFDLLGLPPTPQQINAFLSDQSPDAYHKLIYRLLASPHYGERWARHWMDVVHFAETHGHDQDRLRPHAWPYRDYLIRSFNNDTPYPRFVQEQLAGDVLYPDDPQGIIATGFIVAGPWDESSLLNIVDDTVDKKIARNLDRDDMVTATMLTFLSTTVQCARCHNHKFDPITQAEYYSLQAVFAGIDRANRPYDVDAETNKLRQSLLRRKTALEARRIAAAHLLDPAVQDDVAAWEKSLPNQGRLWTILDPVTMTSAEGATPTKQPDGSVLFTGKKPESDTYTIVAHCDLRRISGVRLEVLIDDSLPQQGPGRHESGNFRLSEFKIQAAPQKDPKAAKSVPLHFPTADFEQETSTIAMAIDSKSETGWGTDPQVGMSHQALFATKKLIEFEGGAVLTFVLEQKHGTGHTIGRLRLSVTTAPTPLEETQDIEQILAKVPDERSDEQKAELGRYVSRLGILEQLAALPPPQMVYAAAADFAAEGNFKPAGRPRPVYVLGRGDVSQPRQLAPPGALACIRSLEPRFALSDPDDEGSRRAALAKWISAPNNGLAWRSIVNRVWHYHFGRGIVDTPNDLGRRGARPTHPELLDWLAIFFRESGGSLKQLHKLILTSSVYTQSSKHNEGFAKVDSENRLLWRMNRIRLDAESVRDAVLSVAGKLDEKMSGPSVKQFIQSPGVHVTPKVDYLNFDVDDPANYRRSVYRFLFRTLPDPFMESLDCADASQLTPVRSTSVTPQQALAMLNNPFIVRQSEHFAERLGGLNLSGDEQIQAAYQLALGRPPTPGETAGLAAFSTKHGLANTCRLILNTNEFMFVH